MRNPVTVAVVALAALLAGCRTTKDILDDYDNDLASGAYEHATVEVSQKADDGGVDGLLWQLQSGAAQYLAGDRQEAIRRFDLAEDAFIVNDGQSVFSQGSGTAMAMMTNDRAFPYGGAGQDRIFTCLYKAIDYASQGNVDSARTELNRVAQHQENWIYERRKDIESAEERLKKEADEYAKKNNAENKSAGTVEKAFADASFSAQIKEKCDFDTETSGDLERLSAADYSNAYAQYVCGVFRWLSGDGGRDFIRDAAGVKPDNVLLKADLQAVDAGQKPKNMVWVFVEDGLCPTREEWRLDLPLVLIPYLNQYVMYAGMALPTLKYRNAAVTGYSLVAGDVNRPMVELENIDRLMKVEYDVYMRGALAREITRTIVKVGAQVALGVTAEHAPSYSSYALKASQVAAAAWAASVTAADLRCWTALPKSVYAMRALRPADGVLTVNCGLENVAVNLPEGNTMVFIRKTSSVAPAVVKSFTFPN